MFVYLCFMFSVTTVFSTWQISDKSPKIIRRKEFMFYSSLVRSLVSNVEAKKNEAEERDVCTRDSWIVCLPIVLTNSKFQINNRIKSFDSIFLTLAHEKSFLRICLFFSLMWIFEKGKKKTEQSKNKTKQIQ